MLNWIGKNKWKILIGVLAFTAGILANFWANRRSEQKIIAAITAQINELKNKRLTPDEHMRLTELQAQLKLLTQ